MDTRNQKSHSSLNEYRGMRNCTATDIGVKKTAMFQLSGMNLNILERFLEITV